MYQNKFILRLHKTISNGKVKIKSIRTIKLTVYQNSFQNILEYDNVKKMFFTLPKLELYALKPHFNCRSKTSKYYNESN